MLIDLFLNGIIKVTEPFVYKGGSRIGSNPPCPYKVKPKPPHNPPPKEIGKMSIEVVTGPKTAQTLQELSVEVKVIVRDALNQISQLSPDSPGVVDTLLRRHWPDPTQATEVVCNKRRRRDRNG